MATLPGLDPISSVGTRDGLIDLTAYFESSEVISTVTATSSAAAVLAISSAAVTSSETTFNGVTSAAGKGITYSLTGGAGNLGTVTLSFVATGDSGTKELFTTTIEVVASIAI